MATETGIPKLDAPFVQENERAPGASRIIAIPWYMLLVELWRRTGSGSGIAPTMVQTGVVQEFAGTTAPTGYLMCNGAAYLAVDYPDLFAVIGYRFGGAAGTFNVPDRRNRFAVGAGGAIAPNVGDVGGAVSTPVTILQANLPNYALTVNDPGHNHTQNSHNHTQDAHNHTQNAHTHTQDAHNHTQNSHNHTQDAHNHTQDAHNHTLVVSGISSGALSSLNGIAEESTSATKPYLLRGKTGIRNLGTSSSDTATNQATTATNQATTATNIATTATNQNTTATNIATTATNQATTATNNSNTTGITVSSAGSNTAINVPTLPPYIGMNFIIKT